MFVDKYRVVIRIVANGGDRMVGGLRVKRGDYVSKTAFFRLKTGATAPQLTANCAKLKSHCFASIVAARARLERKAGIDEVQGESIN